MPRWCLLCLAGVLVLAQAPGAESDLITPHEAVLKAAGIKSDGAALLDFFRKRTLLDAERDSLSALVRDLGADTYAVRTKATEALVAAGQKAIPFLRHALEDSDPEVARRTRWCLRAIEATPETPLVLAAAALLALRKPAGAAEVLMGYLPSLEDDAAEAALFEALMVVGVREGKVEPALRAAVRGKTARQRAAAAWVLGRLPGAAERNLVVPLLSDPEARVRFLAAEALVAGKDRRGIPALVALLEGAPLEIASEAESLLGLLAGENAALAALAADKAERKKCHEAWEKWWREQGPALDLTKMDLASRVIGLRLVVANSGYGGGGAVWEHGGDHKPRWQLRNLGGPFDARVLSGGRVLLAEYDAGRVTERDRTGKILWEYRPPMRPLEVQRLANGNTLITTNGQVVEVTPAKNVVFAFNDRPGQNIFTAQKLPGGNILVGLYTGHIIELSPTGKEIHRIAIERVRGLANIVVLPGGTYLVPLRSTNRIVEVDRTGKVVREVAIPVPTTVAVLPGGNLLVGSHVLSNVREIDRKGNVLWQQKAEGQVFRVRVR